VESNLTRTLMETDLANGCAFNDAIDDWRETDQCKQLMRFCPKKKFLMAMQSYVRAIDRQRSDMSLKAH